MERRQKIEFFRLSEDHFDTEERFYSSHYDMFYAQERKGQKLYFKNYVKRNVTLQKVNKREFQRFSQFSGEK